MSVSFSWSRAGDNGAVRAPHDNRGAPAVGRTQTVSLQDQLQRVRDAWNPQNPACAFQHYFYDRVSPEHASQYTMPPGHDQAKWEKAMAQRPDSSSVPVLAVGFDALRTRGTQQQQQVNAYRVRLHELAGKLTELAHRHDLHTAVRLSEIRARQTALAAKTLKLAIRLQMRAARGTGLSPEEEAVGKRLKELLRSADDPSVFGSLTEIWARIHTAPRSDSTVPEQILDWDRDTVALEHVAAVLAAQQAGIRFLASLIESDTAVVEASSLPEDKNDEESEHGRQNGRLLTSHPTQAR